MSSRVKSSSHQRYAVNCCSHFLILETEPVAKNGSLRTVLYCTYSTGTEPRQLVMPPPVRAMHPSAVAARLAAMADCIPHHPRPFGRGRCLARACARRLPPARSAVAAGRRDARGRRTARATPPSPMRPCAAGGGCGCRRGGSRAGQPRRGGWRALGGLVRDRGRRVLQGHRLACAAGVELPYLLVHSSCCSDGVAILPPTRTDAGTGGCHGH